jgi:hypothetical protein
MANSIPLRFYLQIEGLAFLATATAVYAAYSFSWWLYAILFFAPDLFMLGYLKNPRVGALIYNLGHTYTVPLMLIGTGVALPSSHALAVGLIWGAHIGFDRLFGYGLKYDSGFKNTHLQKLS